ncbi:MAG: hypothetical protein NE330_20395 [Lentisphaeraceae bacterium]|nr:hypothetical protein [Lentisphaeraceae bacterium]
MTKRICTLFAIYSASLLFTGCQTKTPKAPVVTNDKYDGLELLINVDHFKGEKCQQKVSPFVYSKLAERDLKSFVADVEYVRHHSLALMKMGRCDNIVMKYDELNKEYIYVCGGHTSAER